MLTEIYIINKAFYIWLKLKHLYFCRYSLKMEIRSANSLKMQTTHKSLTKTVFIGFRNDKCR